MQRRRLQNRVSQRLFRERQANYRQELEKKVETLSDALQNFRRLYEELRGECEQLKKETGWSSCRVGTSISNPSLSHSSEVGFDINLSNMDFPDVRLPEMGLALHEGTWGWASAQLSPQYMGAPVPQEQARWP
jgi:FtsZ-binding cell division protein ZapB